MEIRRVFFCNFYIHSRFTRRRVSLSLSTPIIPAPLSLSSHPPGRTSTPLDCIPNAAQCVRFPLQLYGESLPPFPPPLVINTNCSIQTPEMCLTFLRHVHRQPTERVYIVLYRVHLLPLSRSATLDGFYTPCV